jgi:hypothetical protein
VTVTVPKSGVSTVSLRLDKGAVKLTSKARRKVRRGRKLNLNYKVVAVETSGNSFRSQTSARARRR